MAGAVTAFLLVGLGGALGAMARFGAGRLIGRMMGVAGFPYATLAVNISGGFLMGLLVGWLASRGEGDGWRQFLGVGVLGGFTTFSAFSLEIMLMLERGETATAAIYVLASVLMSVCALALGLWLARWGFA